MAECANIMAPRSYDMICCNETLVINNVNIVNSVNNALSLPKSPDHLPENATP
jgi:hypothetical protein